MIAEHVHTIIFKTVRIYRPEFEGKKYKPRFLLGFMGGGGNSSKLSHIGPLDKQVD